MVCGRAYSMAGQVFRWSQSALYATAVGLEIVYSLFDPVKWPKCRLAFMGELFFFQVLKNLVVRGRVSSTGGKVSK